MITEVARGSFGFVLEEIEIFERAGTTRDLAERCRGRGVWPHS